MAEHQWIEQRGKIAKRGILEFRGFSEWAHHL